MDLLLTDTQPIKGKNANRSQKWKMNNFVGVQILQLRRWVVKILNDYFAFTRPSEITIVILLYNHYKL